MNNKFLFVSAILLTIIVNMFLYTDYFGQYVFYPHVDCNKPTEIGDYYLCMLAFNNFFLMPFVFFWLGKGLNVNYLSISVTKLLFVIFYVALNIFPSLMYIIFEPHNCDAPQLTLFGKFFVVGYMIIFSVQIIIGPLLFFNRISYWFNYFKNK
jgi:hypothetical protein